MLDFAHPRQRQTGAYLQVTLRVHGVLLIILCSQLRLVFTVQLWKSELQVSSQHTGTTAVSQPTSYSDTYQCKEVLQAAIHEDMRTGEQGDPLQFPVFTMIQASSVSSTLTGMGIGIGLQKCTPTPTHLGRVGQVEGLVQTEIDEPKQGGVELCERGHHSVIHICWVLQ